MSLLKLKYLINIPIRFIQFIKLKHPIYLLLLSLASLLCHTLNAQEFTHPLLFSFEESVSPLVPDKHSVLKITREHYKHGMHSVAWKWEKGNSQISVKQQIGYLNNNPDPKECSVSTFVFWIYSKKALSSQKLRFEFLKKGKVCSWFDYGMNFNGWRGAWIAFDRDMKGEPEEGMDELLLSKKPTPLEQLRQRFNSYNIQINPDGTLKGIPVFFSRFAETYYSMGAERSTRIYNTIGQSLNQANNLLLSMAREYHHTNTTTTIEFTCREGKTRETLLVK
jgi:Lyase, N terminal/Lyase, catalytic